MAGYASAHPLSTRLVAPNSKAVTETLGLYPLRDGRERSRRGRGSRPGRADPERSAAAIASLSGTARRAPRRSSRPEPSRKVRSRSRTRTIRTRPRKPTVRASASARTARRPSRSLKRLAHLGLAGVREPDSRKLWVGAERNLRDRARARRHEPGLRPAASNRDRVLGPNGHPQGVREAPVVACGRHVGELGQAPLDLARVQRQQALPLDRSERGAHVSGDRRWSAFDLDRLHGEHRRGAREQVEADRAEHDREADQERPARREEANDGRALERRQLHDRGAGAGTLRGALGHVAGFAATNRRSYRSGGSSSGPRNSTSCTSSTPNWSNARRRASAISATASSVRAPSAFSMKFAWRGEICAPPIRCPFKPAGLEHPPRAELVLRVLEHAPERALVGRLRGLAQRLQPGDVRLDLLLGQWREAELGARDHLAVVQLRVPVAEAELLRSEPACARGRRRRAPGRGSLPSRCRRRRRSSRHRRRSCRGSRTRTRSHRDPPRARGAGRQRWQHRHPRAAARLRHAPRRARRRA